MNLFTPETPKTATNCPRILIIINNGEDLQESCHTVTFCLQTTHEVKSLREILPLLNTALSSHYSSLFCLLSYNHN